MAKKPHKYAGARLELTTALAPQRIAELSKSVAEGVRKVRFEGASSGQTHFSVRHLGGVVEWMTFDVSIATSDEGSKVTTAIGRYLTTQPTVLAIPVGPKEMLGYKIYRKYLHALAEAVAREDSAARHSVTELATI